ncbi:MAG: hypothetical protein ABIL70_05595 [candidate division WOR-3 bacterium]
MDSESFTALYENLQKNLEEIKNNTTKKDRYSIEDKIKITEKTKYLFYGLVKTLVDLGNRIIEENDFRRPLNNADVFICLAEHEIITSNIVPAVKKAVFALPQLYGFAYDEFFAIVEECLSDLRKCLDSYAVYYNLKGKK